MPEETAAREVAITRVYEAPRQLVWDAWTDPDQLANWWGPRGWTVKREATTLEVRPGGAFQIVGVSAETGEEMPTAGVYREVVEPERLVLVEGGDDNWHEGAVSVLTLTDLGDGRTRMDFRTTIHMSDEYAEQAQAGMASSFDRLGEQLKGR